MMVTTDVDDYWGNKTLVICFQRWGGWGGWGGCSATCGKGTRFFLLLFLRFVWIKFSWILICGKGTRFFFFFFSTCLSVLDVWVEIVCRLILFEAVCVFRAEAHMCAQKKGLLNFYIRAQAKLTRPPED